MNDVDHPLGEYKIHHANSLELMKSTPEQSFDSVITDPPYAGFGFNPRNYMVGFKPYLIEMLRVTKRDMKHKRLAVSQPEGRVARLSRIIPGSYRLIRISDAFADSRGTAATFYLRNPIEKTFRDLKLWSDLPDTTHSNSRDVNKLAGLIQMMSQPGDTIFDPFCGSGSTGLAAVLMGRHFVGVELMEDRAEDARQRFVKIGAQETR
ncbi:MAG: site-specific DNA-methyltransferase [Pseudomonadales bacterium]|nr:site-specific DNA-methyltransferase [Pseudomonadales bacterium]MBO7006570.1 site-specific DNA-methyltransferase [Pseudomonadales bacterium]